MTMRQASILEGIDRFDDVEPVVLTHHAGLKGRSEAAARFWIGQMIVEHEKERKTNERGQDRARSSLLLPMQVFGNLGLVYKEEWYYACGAIYKHFKSMASLVREMNTMEARGETVKWTKIHDRTRPGSRRRSQKRHRRPRRETAPRSSHTFTYEGDIQAWILNNFDKFAAACGAKDLTIISTEYPVAPAAYVDLLAVAGDGTPFVIELKHTMKAKLTRVEPRRELIGQVIEYMNALDLAHSLASERDKLGSYLRDVGVGELIQHRFWSCVNANPPQIRTVIVTELYVPSLGEIVLYMRERLDIDIDYAYFQETISDGETGIRVMLA